MQIFSKTEVDGIALALNNGKAAVLPTDTVWGIASLNERHIYTIKKRDPAKKVVKFIASTDDIPNLPPFFADVLKHYWPGSLTVVWKGFGYRMPKCEYILQILRQTGPLYCSSANVSGQPPITLCQQVFSIFKESLDILAIVDNAPYEVLSQKPSTVVDLDTLTVLRDGEVNGNEVIALLKKGK